MAELDATSRAVFEAEHTRICGLVTEARRAIVTDEATLSDRRARLAALVLQADALADKIGRDPDKG